MSITTITPIASEFSTMASENQHLVTELADSVAQVKPTGSGHMESPILKAFLNDKCAFTSIPHGSSIRIKSSPYFQAGFGLMVCSLLHPSSSRPY